MVRADAAENRARILDVAREAFALDGETSMNQIAQRAGVGAGTLYRNYPTREALVLAVYQADVAKLVDSVPRLLRQHPPIDALRIWATQLVAVMRKKHGLGDALSAASHQRIIAETYDPVITAIATLLDAGKANGTIRLDADPRDVLQLSGALWRAAGGPGDRAPAMLALILDGLAPAPGPQRSSPSCSRQP